MKTIYFYSWLSIYLLVFIQVALTQNMVVVNNTPGVKADYKTLQGAIDAVAPGTLILVQPGVTTYGDIVIKKRVAIIGAGYFLGQNPAPFSQATIQSSIVDRINFDSLSNGTYVTGLSINSPVTSGINARLTYKSTSNITVSRCIIARTGHPTSAYCLCFRSTGIVLKQCYFQGMADVNIIYTSQTTGIEFHNNIFDGQTTHLPVEIVTSNTALVLFENNTMFNITSEYNNPSILTFINNTIFQNIFGGGGEPTISAFAAFNNVTNVPFSIPGLNITNAVFNNVFVLNSDPTITPTLDARFKLKPGSPAIGYGQNNTDCGAFGGMNGENYELSGIAEFVPNIFFLNVPTVGTATGGLPVHIKVRANK